MRAARVLRDGGMQGLVIVLAMLCPAAALGRTKAVKPSYPIRVRVMASKYAVIPSQFPGSGGDLIDELTVMIGGKKYLWAAPTGRKKSLFRPGNYQARVISDEHYAPYEVRRQYRMLLPDGKTIKVMLMGMKE